MVAVKYWSRTTANSIALLLVSIGLSCWAVEPDVAPVNPVVQAVESEAQRLAQQLEGLRSYSADFTQTVLGGRNEVLQQSSGRVHIARPDRFKWVVAQPYPQTLVTVSDKLYLYDPDLEQLTVEPLEEAMAGTPALILTGSSERIDALFRVVAQVAPGNLSDAGAATNEAVFSLYPKDASALFAEIRMRFNGEQQLSHLDIVDHLGQLTQVNFANISYNVPLPTNEFEFVVPPGTDVIGELHTP